MAELTGKVAMVTGAASGIGEASVRALAAAGAKVVVADLNEERAKAVADSIKATGGDAIAVAFDTSDEAQVAAGVAAAVAAFGGIDILHNNAAITSVDFMMRDGMIHELDVELWDKTMAVNVRGYMLCTKHVVPLMLSRGGGVIVNTSSGAGMQGELVRSAYGTSKAAVTGFTRSVATQYGKLGIRCVTVMPGLTMTPTVAANMPPPMIEMMKRHTLTRELAKPEDIANAVVFLASDQAAFITGATIPVDGGFGIHGPSYADEVAMWAAASGAAGAAVAEKVRSALDARYRARLEADDVALLEGLLADDAVWHGAGLDVEDDARGRSELIRRWNELTKVAKGSPRIEVGDIYTDGDHLVAVLELSTGDNGTGRTVRQANILHINDDGKATEIWAIPDNGAVAKSLSNGEAVQEHPNVATFRAAEEARARNKFGPEDLGHIERFLREDVRWISPWGQGPTSREQVVAQFGTFNQATGGTMQLTLNEIFADDTHAVSLVRLQADRPDRPGKHMDVKEANVFHLDAQGQAYEFWGVADDQAAINKFWT
jgi:NAD(P)-dependent dehydrogenase (short-subunit alcohol dehydrogenase family)/ketosteroid isomerase-like protein